LALIEVAGRVLISAVCLGFLMAASKAAESDDAMGAKRVVKMAVEKAAWMVF
jgi:hypothetical protein